MKTCACSDCHAGETTESSGSALPKPHTHEHPHDDCCGHEHQGGAACGFDTRGHDHGHSHGGGQLTTVKQDAVAVTLALICLAAGILLRDLTAGSAFIAASILAAGLPIFKEGIRNIARLKLEELALLTVAVIAAVALGELFEAALVTILFRLGEILEELAAARSKREIDAVAKIIPNKATLLLDDGTAEAVPSSSLAVGSRIMLKSGESLPVDCRVLSGSSSIDTSSLTGESLPREAVPGDTLLSGSINLGGVLICETVSRFEDSTASKIIEMVRDSAAKKGSAEKLISKFARVYTPIVMAMAALVAFVPPLLGMGDLRMWVYRALVFLVASCPCALVIATPLAFFAGIGAASRQGILIKGSKYMEALAKATTVVFDKTGTLTTGRLKVSGIAAVQGWDKDELLRLAAMCESASTHPMAQAVTAAAGKAADISAMTRCEEITGRGMRAVIGGDEVLCGSARLMSEAGISLDGLPDAPLYLAKNAVAIGAILLSDQPRDDASDCIRQLSALGVSRTAMLTGDAKDSALEIQRLTGVGDAYHSLLPGDKVDRFEELKASSKGGCVFVGDGINDSPVLARSDIGVAMGLASDAAMQSADVVLISDRLSSLPQAIRISRRVSGLARAIIAFALLVKASVLILAFLGGAQMWHAVFADVGVSILSVLAATTALRQR